MLVKLAAFLLLATLLVQNNVNATLNLGSSGLPAVPTPLGQNDIANKAYVDDLVDPALDYMKLGNIELLANSMPLPGSVELVLDISGLPASATHLKIHSTEGSAGTRIEDITTAGANITLRTLDSCQVAVQACMSGACGPFLPIIPLKTRDMLSGTDVYVVGTKPVNIPTTGFTVHSKFYWSNGGPSTYFHFLSMKQGPVNNNNNAILWRIQATNSLQLYCNSVNLGLSISAPYESWINIIISHDGDKTMTVHVNGVKYTATSGSSTYDCSLGEDWVVGTHYYNDPSDFYPSHRIDSGSIYSFGIMYGRPITDEEAGILFSGTAEENVALKTDLGTPVWSYIPNVTEDATVVGSPSYIAETFSC